VTDDVARVTRVTTDPDSRAELLGRYLEGGSVLRRAIAGLDAEALRARPIAGKMSSLEVLCHVVDADQFMCDRMKRTVGTDRPLLMGVEAVDYLTLLHYHDRDPELDMRLLDVQREQMAADFGRLCEDAWVRIAIHSEVGALNLQQLLNHAVCHLEAHAETIDDKRAAMGL
jgi:uncharacterized damage-inducible protein DinB